MGIRETLNENPRVTTGLTIGIIVIVLGLLAWQIWGGSSPSTPPPGAVGKKFFTDDDGKTWYADDYRINAPYQHNGKEADEAFVYRCDGKTFVNHMQRYTPEGKKRMEAMQHTASAAADGGMDVPQSEIEVKAPGGKEWLKGNDPKSAEIRKPKCTKLDEMEIVRP